MAIRIAALKAASSPLIRATDHQGFGSKLLTMAATQLGGRLEVDWRDSALRVGLTFPVRPAR